MRVLPILFNTQMAQAILDGRKSVTRRLVKHDVESMLNSPFHKKHPDVTDKQIIEKLCLPPYQPGDTLYVRETWSEWDGGYVYKAWGGPFPQPGQMLGIKWHPSLHMPKEAARIFLKVTEVHIEKLREITEEQARKEGCYYGPLFEGDSFEIKALSKFPKLWDSTIKKTEEDKYGWDANPWVWVIEFERCEKPKGFGGENG